MFSRERGMARRTSEGVLKRAQACGVALTTRRGRPGEKWESSSGRRERLLTVLVI